MNQFCAICKKTAVQSCSACNSIYYCSKEHQKLHWKNHKSSCAPFKITNDEFGKTLTAIRNIKPGEKIITKLPLLTVPKSEKDIICINCYKKIDQNNKNKCNKCGLKFCGENCELKGHSDFCKIFEKANVNIEKLTNFYQFITPLKILMIKSLDYKKFDFIMSNYLYEEPRKENFMNILTQLKLFCEKLKISSTDDELSKIYVISKRNFIDITNKKIENTKGLYPVIPLLKQNCVPNTKQIFFDDANQLSVIATINIKKGETLTANFTDSLWGTLERQNYLKINKFINCTCKRCKDPKELNTYMSSVYCQKCKDIILEDNTPKILSTNSLNLEADWKCEKCENIISSKQIMFGNKSLGREILSQNMEQPKCLEHFLFKYGEILHPTNSFSLRVKFKLIQLYGNTEEFKITELPEELIERKMQLCHELLEIADIIEPGYSRFRGIILYELQATIVMQTKREFCKDLITKSEAEDKLRKSLDILNESCKILLIEPEFKETLQEKFENLNKMIEI